MNLLTLPQPYSASVFSRNHFDGTSGFELNGRTIGFYGFGFVARAVFKLAKAMGMTAKAYDPYLKDEQISEIGRASCRERV